MGSRKTERLTPFGEQIRKYRQKGLDRHGSMTVKEMSHLLKLSTGRISCIENGTFLPSLTYIRKCKSLFRLSDHETLALFHMAYDDAKKITIKAEEIPHASNDMEIILKEIIAIVCLSDQTHYASLLLRLITARDNMKSLLDSPSYVTTDDIEAEMRNRLSFR